ncbi:TPA: restriction endonuclease [Bacillus toyonensis]|nr:restriction endonuclease [Bacillus toyonensis]
MPITKWNEIDDKYFEKFVYYLLAYEGEKFYNRIWFGKGGGDKGRDVVAKTFEQLPFGLGYERKWVFQCKRWSKMPDKSVLMNEYYTALEHEPDYWVLVVPLEPSAQKHDYKDFMQGHFKSSANCKIQFITLVQIEEILHKYPALEHVLLTGEFPKTKEEPEGVKLMEIKEEGF